MAEVIGHITASTKVQLRDGTGRFRALLHRAAIATARELTDKAVELAKRNHAPNVKSGELLSQIEPEYAGKVGYVRSNAEHAHPIEAGAIPHAIPRGDTIIMHPGNRAYPYLEPVGSQLAAYAPGIAAKHYP